MGEELIKVRFTDVVQSRFGGAYVRPDYTATAGTIMELPASEVAVIEEHPGLVERVTGSEKIPGALDRKQRGGSTK